MIKPVNEFGGWLRFFWFWAMINLILVLASTPIYYSGILPEDFSLTFAEEICSIIFSSAYILAMALMLLSFTKKTPSTPNFLFNISISAFWILIMQAIFFGILDQRGFLESFEFPNGGLWLPVLSIYLQKSKRVKAYYGSNTALQFDFKTSD